ncbi:MAG: 4-hydroxy-3-methylbut-2-enyl diphosphate reductase [Burkholderiales bacterium]|nr:4-hydroxy-3-methylbut-2-enyl diphosphate reductase [Burkholderiales bacterium]MBP9768237.1 4-hydroxy-3-methylbut-2-enyl diphosphate reductase [Burkholderiales bacterium]
MKKIILANPRGFCAGVDRAITIVEKALEKYGAPVYVRHEVVHNKYVVDGLKQRGAIFIEEIKDVPESSILIYSAHGVPLAVREEALAKNLTMVFDATCPLVSKVHVEIKNLHRQNYTIIMIGHKGHPEVEGTMGQVTDHIHLIENEADIENLTIPRDIEKIAVVTQTTLSVDETKSIIAKLMQVFSNLRLPKNEDICYATQNRQDAVKEMAEYCDVVLVIGSKNSSNSNRLKELAENLGVKAYLIDFDYEIQSEWLNDASTVGVTAGASAPEVLVEGVIKRLQQQGFLTTEILNVVEEHMTFALPSELR